MKKIIFFIAAIFIFAGCVHIPASRLFKIKYAENPVSYFNYPTYQEKYPPINGKYYQKKDAKYGPAIIVLPIMKGGEPIANHIGKTLNESGFNVYIVKWEEDVILKNNLESLKTEEDFKKSAVYIRDVSRQRVIKIRQLIDWLSLKPEVNPNKIGICGVSLGGIIASLILEIDPRIKSGAILLAGADIGHIFAYSQEKGIKNYRNLILKKLNWGIEKFEKTLNQILAPVDPINYTQKTKSEKILMINGLYDTVIPEHSQMALWLALDQPEQYFILAGHYSALLWIPWADYKIVYHFKKSLT